MYDDDALPSCPGALLLAQPYLAVYNTSKPNRDPRFASALLWVVGGNDQSKLMILSLTAGHYESSPSLSGSADNRLAPSTSASNFSFRFQARLQQGKLLDRPAIALLPLACPQPAATLVSPRPAMYGLGVILAL